MKKLLLGTLLVCGTAAVARLLEAQTVPRQPVVKLRPVLSATPSPTPTPLPDPTGVYQGQASVRVQGQTPTYAQTWRIAVRAQPCQECEPGQYFVYGTNYDGSQYQSGATERGGVYGIINPNGSTVGLQLFAINCSFVNPSNYRPPLPGTSGDVGYEYGGSFGDVPGAPLTIRGGVLAGRFSGRDCFGQQITADVSLQRQSSVVPSSCGSIAGSYSATFANSCGGSRSGTITINQTGCYLSTSVEVFGAGIEGTMTSPTSATIRINDPLCGTAIYGGSATINGRTITGTYSGSSTGGSGCCPAGPFSGSFALTKN